jgi:hypothetical protein
MVRKLRLLGGFLAHPSTIPIWIDEQYMARAHARWWNMMEDWLFVVRKQ